VHILFCCGWPRGFFGPVSRSRSRHLWFIEA
jgi:hypothetical protein